MPADTFSIRFHIITELHQVYSIKAHNEGVSIRLSGIFAALFIIPAVLFCLFGFRSSFLCVATAVSFPNVNLQLNYK